MIKIKFGLLLIMLVFASDNQEKKVEGENTEEKSKQNADLILVKIEEDEYTKARKKTSEHIGVYYSESYKKWSAQRWSKKENKTVYNGTYNYEETAAHASDTLAKQFMKNGEKNYKFNFPDDDTEVFPEKNPSSMYIGVSYSESNQKWRAQRWSKIENKMVHNGYYKDEETAAHASDTLARKLMANGEQNHNLNFPDDDAEVNRKKTTSSVYIGITYLKKYKVWSAQRRSKNEKKMVHNGSYKNEETAAHASDTLARKLMRNGEQNHKLNFPDDDTEVYQEKTKYCKYFGVYYNEKYKRWVAQRWSKMKKRRCTNGYYKDEETAAHASDNLARKLMANGEQNHNLNFPDDEPEENAEHQTNKRKRPFDFENSQKEETNFEKFEEKEK